MTETARIRIDAGSNLIPQARVVCETLVTRSAPTSSSLERSVKRNMNESGSPHLPKMQGSRIAEDKSVRRQVSACSCLTNMSIQSSSSEEDHHGGCRDERDMDALCSFLEEDMVDGAGLSVPVGEKILSCCQATTCESGVSSVAECNILLHGNSSDGWGGESKLRLVTGEAPWKYWRLGSSNRGIPAFIFAKDASRGRLFVHGTERGRLRLIKSSLPDPESVDVDTDTDDPRIFFHVYSHQREGGFLVPSVFYNDDVPERSVSVNGNKVILSDHDENTSDLWVVEDS